MPTWTAECNNAGDSGSIWNVEKCASYPPAKHMRMFYHAPSKSMVIAGGDHGVSMPHPGYYDGTGSEITAVNNQTGAWKILRPFCVKGEPQPDRPDNVPWVYDSKRDRAIMTPGYYGHKWVGSGCGEVAGWGAYAFDFKSGKYDGPDDAVGIPAPPVVGWGGDRGASYGVYVEATDEMCRLRQSPAAVMECVNLGNKKWRFSPLSIGKRWNPEVARTQSVIDQRDLSIYWLDIWGDGDGTPQNPGPAHLAKTDVRTGKTTRVRLPPQWKGIEGLAGDVFLAFDTINRVLLIPNSFDMAGSPLLGLGIYHVDSGQWEWENVPPSVMGSAWGYDENVGALIGIGKRHPPYGTFLYRYAPNATRAPAATSAPAPIPAPTPPPPRQ